MWISSFARAEGKIVCKWIDFGFSNIWVLFQIPRAIKQWMRIATFVSSRHEVVMKGIITGLQYVRILF